MLHNGVYGVGREAEYGSFNNLVDTWGTLASNHGLALVTFEDCRIPVGFRYLTGQQIHTWGEQHGTRPRPTMEWAERVANHAARVPGAPGSFDSEFTVTGWKFMRSAVPALGRRQPVRMDLGIYARPADKPPEDNTLVAEYNCLQDYYAGRRPERPDGLSMSIATVVVPGVVTCNEDARERLVAFTDACAEQFSPVSARVSAFGVL